MRNMFNIFPVNSRANVELKKSATLRLVAILFSTIALAATVLSPAQARTTTVAPWGAITISLDQGKYKIIPPVTNSPGTWSFKIMNTKIATVSGYEITPLAAGYSQIEGTIAASGEYGAVTRTTQLQVTPGTPKLGAYPDFSIPFSATPFTLTPPTSQSNGPWIYTSSNPAIVSIEGKLAYPHDGGSVTLTASQFPTNDYKTVSVTTTLTVNAIKPTIGNFTGITIAKDSVGSVNLTPPTSNSTGAWRLTSSNPNVATVVGYTLTPVSIGTTTVTASQVAAMPYGSASASMVVTITAAVPQVGNFENLIVPFATSGSKTVSLTPPTSNSPGAWNYTTSDSAVATIAGNIVTYYKPGVVTISAQQAATGNFGAFGPVKMVLTIQGTPVLSSSPDIQKAYGDAPFNIAYPTTTGPAGLVFSSSDTAVVAVVGNTFTIGGAGSVLITATSPAVTAWSPATSNFRINVTGVAPNVGALNPMTVLLGATNIPITSPTSDSPGQWVYSVSDSSVAVISGNTVTALKAGKTTLMAQQKNSGKYTASITLQAQLSVNAPVKIPTATTIDNGAVVPGKPAVKNPTKSTAGTKTNSGAKATARTKAVNAGAQAATNAITKVKDLTKGATSNLTPEQKKINAMIAQAKKEAAAIAASKKKAAEIVAARKKAKAKAN